MGRPRGRSQFMPDEHEGQLSLKIEPYGKIQIATVQGVTELTDNNADKLQEELLAFAMKRPHAHLLVHMKNVNYMTSAALRVFITVRQTMVERGGSMWITGVNDNIRKVFEVTNLNSVFHTDKAAATAAEQYTHWVEHGAK